VDKPSISDSTTFVAASDLLATGFGTEVVILNLGDGVYYTLDEVGGRVWSLLSSPVTLQTICDVLVSEYEVGRPDCERDVRELIDALASRGLVEVR
jgi:hypothetical protein